MQTSGSTLKDLSKSRGLHRLHQHAKQGNDTFEIAQDLELPYEVVSEILNMAERRKYSYKEIAADAQVAEATVYNYHKRMLARENLSI